jgi:hypothetical protein
MAEVRNASNYDFTRGGHVQEDLYTNQANPHYGFISAETIVIASLARNTSTGDFLNNTYGLDDFIPIGVIENVNLAQQKNIQQLFEIGSKDSYFVPGRTIIQVALNRVLLDGDSLMRVMYPTKTGDSANMDEFDSSVLGTGSPPGTTNSDLPDLWFNLAATFLNKPATLALLFYDDQRTLLGSIVLVDAVVESHNIAIAAAQTVITENVRIRVSKIASLSSS